MATRVEERIAPGAAPLPLELALDGERLCFASPRELEFALAGRTSLPPEKLARVMEQPEEALRREAQGIRAVEKVLADVLTGMREDVTSIGSFLSGLDRTLISKDHGWREILSALERLDADFERYKRVALLKYLQYLSCRQQVLRSVFALRHGAAGPEDRDGSELSRTTVIFDLNALAESGECEGEFLRLPKGEPVEIELDPERAVDLLLARHRCAIVLRGQRPVFVDDRGCDHLLRQGCNLIGRDRGNEVVIAAEHRDVSRKHLLVESDGARIVRLTDISSHGTSIHPEHLERTTL